jgi:pimeloyl-ACP methyl ester carboxylesterase
VFTPLPYTPHGLNVVKELYEPLWSDLLDVLQKKGIRVRSIWVPSSITSNPSSLNPESIHDPQNIWSHARDILHMVNTFRTTILQPVIGIGHSVGASHLTMTALLHPSLFASLVLMEPIIFPDPVSSNAHSLLGIALKRKRIWASRDEAESYWTKAYSKSWDPRVVKLWNRYALSPVNQAAPNRETRLAWERTQEIAGYLQFTHTSESGPDIDEVLEKVKNEGPVWVQNIVQLYLLIPYISTRTLFLVGSKPGSAPASIRPYWATRMGSEPIFHPRLNNQGTSKGRGRRVVLEEVQGTGHFLTLEKPTIVAERVGEWAFEELEGWREEMSGSKRWREMSVQEKGRATRSWIEGLKGHLEKAKL